MSHGLGICFTSLKVPVGDCMILYPQPGPPQWPILISHFGLFTIFFATLRFIRHFKQKYATFLRDPHSCPWCRPKLLFQQDEAVRSWHSMTQRTVLQHPSRHILKKHAHCANWYRCSGFHMESCTHGFLRYYTSHVSQILDATRPLLLAAHSFGRSSCRPCAAEERTVCSSTNAFFAAQFPHPKVDILRNHTWRKTILRRQSCDVMIMEALMHQVSGYRVGLEKNKNSLRKAPLIKWSSLSWLVYLLSQCSNFKLFSLGLHVQKYLLGRARGTQWKKV